uniref:ABC transporter domain-containing protein n=1 Tax=Aegilops tauschii subsp. strangulata TaxID=200361 RepID=A0A453CQZ2_AEGTS
GLSLNMLQGWAIVVLCSLENRMISVERILQYMAIPSEPPLTISESRPDCHWPAKGEIELRNLHVKYAPHLPLVLKGVTCTFSGGMKTGIVGRTGGGKSTLIQTLFRIVDPCIGQVLIDGIDISTIGLHDLRTRLSIIPQDPVMFEGTLRSNIDPLNEYSDDQIWEALDCCHLGDEVRKNELKLDCTGLICIYKKFPIDIAFLYDMPNQQLEYSELKCSHGEWRKLERGSTAACLLGKGDFKEETDLSSGRGNFFRGSQNRQFDPANLETAVCGMHRHHDSTPYYIGS